MTTSLALSFSSERFDYQSELPDDYNAGNRFYGKDVAEFIAERLSERGLQSDYMDEDWGWLVFAARGATPQFEVGIYNLAEREDESLAGCNMWGLWIRQYEDTTRFGLLTRRVEVPVSLPIRLAVTDAIGVAGSTAEPWVDGPVSA